MYFPFNCLLFLGHQLCISQMFLLGWTQWLLDIFYESNEFKIKEYNLVSGVWKYIFLHFVKMHVAYWCISQLPILHNLWDVLIVFSVLSWLYFYALPILTSHFESYSSILIKVYSASIFIWIPSGAILALYYGFPITPIAFCQNLIQLLNFSQSTLVQRDI